MNGFWDAQGAAERTAFQRFEAKYRISEVQAQAVRDSIEPYVMADKYAPPNAAYPVNSLYLDGEALELYWSSVMGEKNRFKLRIRSYTDRPAAPVFLEIKRRFDQVIRKQRIKIPRDAVSGILDGTGFTSGLLEGLDDEATFDLGQFRDLMERLMAAPRVNVRYMREAYMSNREESARITFDRELACLHSPSYTPAVWSFGPDWRPLGKMDVILEIKFTDRFPAWVGRLVQRFGLVRRSVAKYCLCVEELRRDGLRVAGGGGGALWTS